MATKIFNSNLDIKGNLIITQPFNSVGTILTFGSEGIVSTRTNAEIISDLGLNSNLTAYVKKTGDTMTGSLTLNNNSQTVIKREMSSYVGTTGFARDIFQLIDSTGIKDAFGWYGDVSNGVITSWHYGYLGATSYNAKSAIRWTSDGRVGIGLTGPNKPLDGYALHIAGNNYVTGNLDILGNVNSAGSISTLNEGTSANWNQAFNWGDHNGKYFPKTSVTLVNTDLNNTILEGIYYGNVWTNAPSGYNSIATVTVKRYSQDWIAQEFLHISSNGLPKKFLRIRYSGTTWGEWKEIATSDTISSYVPYTGATAPVNLGATNELKAKEFDAIGAYSEKPNTNRNYEFVKLNGNTIGVYQAQVWNGSAWVDPFSNGLS